MVDVKYKCTVYRVNNSKDVIIPRKIAKLFQLEIGELLNAELLSDLDTILLTRRTDEKDERWKCTVFKSGQDSKALVIPMAIAKEMKLKGGEIMSVDLFYESDTKAITLKRIGG